MVNKDRKNLKHEGLLSPVLSLIHLFRCPLQVLDLMTGLHSNALQFITQFVFILSLIVISGGGMQTVQLLHYTDIMTIHYKEMRRMDLGFLLEFLVY